MSRATSRIIDLESLSGGVSQQPPHIRNPGQVEDTENFLFSTAEGARKRNGTVFVADLAVVDPNSISPNLSGNDYRLTAVERDGSERYLVLTGDSTFRIFGEDGVEASVTMSAAAETYLDAGSADEDQIRVRPYGDTIFVVNTTVGLADEASASYAIERTMPTPGDVFSFSTAASNYVRAEGDDDADLAGYYQYTLSGDTSLTYGHINGPRLTDEWSQPRAGRWDATATYNPCGFRIAARRQSLTSADFPTASWTAASRTLTVTGGGFTDYTFRAGDMIYVDAWAGTGTDATWFEIESKTSNDAIVLKSGQPYSAGDEANTVDLYDSDSVCRIGMEVEIGVDFSDETFSTMHDIARIIQRELRSANLTNACCVWVVQPGGGGAFQITGPWRSTNAKVYQPTAPTVTGVYDLTQAGTPFVGVTSFTGTGTLGSNPDTRAPESRWTRVAAPGQPEAKPDETTLPIAVIRTAADTFTAALITWNSRTHGDEFSNPIPAPFTDGSTLADLAVHRNRLWLLSGDWLIASQDGDLYNFFLENATNQVDSDPIAVVYGEDESPKGDFLASFRKSLTIFTTSGRQYDLSAPEAFTPTSVVVTPGTRLSTLHVRPTTSGNIMHFIATMEDRAALFESYYDDVSVASAVANVSNHVPDLIPSTARTIVEHANTGMVFVLPASGSYTILVYRSEYDGPRKRLSAWGTLRFDVNYAIVDIAVLGDRLFMVTHATGLEYILEYFPIGRELAETAPYPVHLDRRMALTGTYNGGTNKTEFDLGIQAAGSTINAYVAANGTYSIDATAWDYDAAPGTTIRIPGNLSGQTIVLGRFFTAYLELSRPYRRDEGGQAQIGDRFSIIQMAVTHIDTGEYAVRSQSTNRSDKTSSFTATAGTVDAHGHSRHILSADPDETTIQIRDQSPRPLVIAGVQLETDAAEMGFR